MSLSTALGIAQSALLNTQRQTTIVSRNVSESSNPDYARRGTMLSKSPNGAAIVDVRRSVNEVLFRQNLAAMSSWSAQNTLLTGLDRLDIDVFGTENANSPARLLGELQQALQTYSGSPSNVSVAETAVERARQLVSALNNGSNTIQAFRGDIDRQIVTTVKDLNTLLADFHAANSEVVAGTNVGRDVNDALDQRDAILKKISEIVPVSAIKRGANDVMLTTTAGVTLFETVPREVTFTPTAGYAAGASGNSIYVDGVPLTSGSGANTTASGSLSAMIQLREDVAGGMQAQLDEIARGLITAFAETDPLGVDPDLAGLFTWPGGPALPAAGTLENGLARVIRINAAYDSTVGGNPHLLRDGGANGATYIHNTTGGAAYTNLLISYDNKLSAPMAFDAGAGIAGTVSLSDYSTESIGWFSALRQDASRATENKSALMMRTSEALSNVTGVNIDEEMSLLLDLEHSYQASAKLVQTVDNMLAALLDAVR
ncbi:MAG: flagellar hook-associated protein FlgK [Rhizobiaceae bacterium]|nr:flagellar hook-associated protein FlgK [Rhizobiaceae bacterium]